MLAIGPLTGLALFIFRAIPHNSKCRYGERGTADAKPKAQIILDAAKVSAASGGNSEPKQGQRSQSARGFCPRSTMRVPQPDIIEHFGNADAVPQPPERCLSRQAGIVRCCLRFCTGNHPSVTFGDSANSAPSPLSLRDISPPRGESPLKGRQYLTLCLRWLPFEGSCLQRRLRGCSPPQT